MNDRFYMMIALEEAEKAAEMDEVPVGAILVETITGKILGRAHNQPIRLNDPTGHAEILALRMAAHVQNNYRLTGTTLYTTIEPCIMCMGAIIHARVERLVFGTTDPKWGGAGSLYNLPSDKRFNHALEVESGICREEATEIIRSFFRKKRSR